MKRILITGAGGSPAVNFTRSLKIANEQFHLIGVDCSKYYLHRAETDERFLVPLANEPDYIDVLNHIIAKTDAEFLHVQNDAEMAVISKNRELLKVKTFLPSKETIKTCHNKYVSHLLWVKNNIPQPETFFIRNARDLKSALASIKSDAWVREITGAGGKGSLKTKDFDMAQAWINLKDGWGRFTIAECLTERSTTWSSIWYKGELIVAQERERLYWELNKLAPSGVTGATGTGITSDNPKITEIALSAINTIDLKPHGIYGVDLTYDKNGVPNPTEINIGRFFTTHHFFSRLGINFPHIFVKLGYNEDVSLTHGTINPIPPGYAWIRGIDLEPILTTVNKIEEEENKLGRLRKEIKNE